MKCFWAKCSDHKRCGAYGYCVATAQREALLDRNSLLATYPRWLKQQARIDELKRRLGVK